jgi:acyl-CoA thioesterase-1
MKSLLRELTVVTVIVLSTALGYAASLNIVAIGASNTWGWGVGSQDVYSARLQKILGQRGIEAKVTNAGIIADTTFGMLNRLDSAVPLGTNIVVLQPGTNDRRFGWTEKQRAANIAEIVRRLQRRHIRVIVYDPPIPPSYLQFDGIHFTAAAHAKIAATLAAEIVQAREHDSSASAARVE